MYDKETVIKEIYKAFGQNEYPGDRFLQGSFEGCEPYEEIAPFKQMKDWQNIDSKLLDAHYVALNFFSEAGLRFFLPAYLVADLREELQTAEPLFVLVHGFSEVSIEHQTPIGLFVRKTGRSTFINPKRYGTMTFYDYARWRLSVFSREEAQAIVAYLRYKREADLDNLHTAAIDAALNLYWLERAENAPSAENLKQHLIEEEAYLAAISSKPTPKSIEKNPLTGSVRLRDVTASDLPIFYEQQLDPEAIQMAAFPARARDDFMAHWTKILDDETVTTKTILFDGQVAGNIVSWPQSGQREVGYWLGREYWGQGIATQALSAFLGLLTVRPLYAHVVKHNLASIRVLEKCGFTICGEDQVPSDAGGQEIEEFILKLNANEGDEAP